MFRLLRRSTYCLFPLAFVFLLSTTTSCSREPAVNEQGEKRPNIIIIMADDLGYSDLGCYGGEIKTPNLDQLASRGIRFTQFYNTSRCCPTRAALLTGLYPHQAGVGQMTKDTGKPGYRGYLTDNTVTIAEVLKQAGYQTGMSGKWHVSETHELEPEKQLRWLSHQEDFGPFADTVQYPTARGFDKFFGNIWGVVDYFDPFSLVNGKETVKAVPENYYHTDAISDTAVAYVEQFAKNDKPFFLYVAHTAPHWPLHALESDIRKYENVYKDGWQSIRQKRYHRMIELGLIDSRTAGMSPWMFPDKHWSTNKDSTWDARAMAVHAAMVDRMDQGVGRLISKLKEVNQFDNTLIMFLSDNGASAEDPARYGPGFDRAGSTRKGQEVTFSTTRTAANLPGPQTIHSGIGDAWAHTVNTPFRYYKSKIYEGGICTPLIVHWPDAIRTGNVISKKAGHVIDFMPTCLEVAGATYPTQHKQHAVTPMAGSSLVPIIKTGERHDPDYLFWEHFGSKGLRHGKWKIVQLDNQSPWQLFDLEQDRTEIHDLAAAHPETLNEMKIKWEEMARQTNVYPLPGK